MSRFKTSLIFTKFALLGLVAVALLARPARADSPNGSYLLLTSFNNNRVLRYKEKTGAFVDAFVPRKSGGLVEPISLVFGPDDNLYVGCGLFAGEPNVLRYDGSTGAFIDTFAAGDKIKSTRGIIFGPDGNLYVADGRGNSGTVGLVRKYDGCTGAYLGRFVAPGSGGLTHPSAIVFGPDGSNTGKLDLFVGSGDQGAIYRYDGYSGAFKGIFVPAHSGGLVFPLGIVFGPDGNLYAVSCDLTGTNPTENCVLRYQGPCGPNPGAFMGVFIPTGSGGMDAPTALLFGPGGNKDGKLDLYVCSCRLDFNGKGVFPTVPGTNQVLRFDGTTGAFKGVFVTPDSGGLDYPSALTFTETDPTTLNYNP